MANTCTRRLTDAPWSECPESADELLRNQWTICPGISGRFGLECVDDLARNTHLVYRNWQSSIHSSLGTLRPEPLEMPIESPVVTVIDGHPSALAWVGSMVGQKTYPLGVTRFGESGTPADLYNACQIGWESIYAACIVALGVDWRRG